MVAAAPKSGAERGFTLLEALIAVALLAMVILPFLGMRTRSLEDSAEARQWRTAREIAQRFLSELQAGARETPPTNRLWVDLEDHPGFRFQILIGEAAIADAETQMMGNDTADGPGGSDRLAWQRERETLREANSRGMSMIEYEDQLREQELADKVPSEDEFEDVAILVSFPNIRPSEDESDATRSFMLRASISTMAIQGLTPEQSEQIAEARGEGSSGGGAGSGGEGAVGK
jgi:prepilin-type N-terminal cleavage/methylation domain-containing protein